MRLLGGAYQLSVPYRWRCLGGQKLWRTIAYRRLNSSIYRTVEARDA